MKKKKKKGSWDIVTYEASKLVFAALSLHSNLMQNHTFLTTLLSWLQMRLTLSKSKLGQISIHFKALDVYLPIGKKANLKFIVIQDILAKLWETFIIFKAILRIFFFFFGCDYFQTIELYTFDLHMELGHKCKTPKTSTTTIDKLCPQRKVWKSKLKISIHKSQEPEVIISPTIGLILESYPW